MSRTNLQLSGEYPWNSVYDDFAARRSGVIPRVEKHPLNKYPISLLYDMGDYVVWTIPIDDFSPIEREKTLATLRRAIDALATGSQILIDDVWFLRDIITRQYIAISRGELRNSAFLREEGWNSLDKISMQQRKELFKDSAKVRLALSDGSETLYQIDSMFALDLIIQLEGEPAPPPSFPPPSFPPPPSPPGRPPPGPRKPSDVGVDRLSERTLQAIGLPVLLYLQGFAEEDFAQKKQDGLEREEILLIRRYLNDEILSNLIRDFETEEGLFLRPIDVMYHLDLYGVLTNLVPIGLNLTEKIDKGEDIHADLTNLERFESDILMILKLGLQLEATRDVEPSVLFAQYPSLAELILAFDDNAKKPESDVALAVFTTRVLSDLAERRKIGQQIEFRKKGIAGDEDITMAGEGAEGAITFIFALIAKANLEKQFPTLGEISETEFARVVRRQVEVLLHDGMFRKFDLSDGTRRTFFDVLVSAGMYDSKRIIEEMRQIEAQPNVQELTLGVIRRHGDSLAIFLDAAFALVKIKTVKDPEALGIHYTMLALLKDHRFKLQVEETTELQWEAERIGEIFFNELAASVSDFRALLGGKGEAKLDAEDGNEDSGFVPDLEALRNGLGSGNYGRAKMAFETDSFMSGEEWKRAVAELEDIVAENGELFEEWGDLGEKVDEVKKGV